MNVKNLHELKKYLINKINNSLENEVFETAQKIEISHAKSDVLGVYSPKVYERRGSLGIDNPENIIFKPVKNGTLEMENITQFNPGYETQNSGYGLVKLIEYGHIKSGHSYDYPSCDDFTNPRPFISNTKEEIKETKRHIKALKSGLKRNKIIIK